MDELDYVLAASAASALAVLSGAIFVKELRQRLKNASVFSKPGFFLTHIFSGGLSAYGTLAGWLHFPVGRERLAPRDPGSGMGDTTICSVVPIRRNRNQRHESTIFFSFIFSKNCGFSPSR